MLVVAIAAVAFTAFRTWLDGRWYVGVADAHVAIYRGIPVTVLGFDLSRVDTETALVAAEIEALPVYHDLASGINVDSRDEAVARVAQMRKDLHTAKVDTGQTPGQGPTATPTPSGGATQAPTGGATP